MNRQPKSTRRPTEAGALAITLLLITGAPEVARVWRADREFARGVLRRTRRPGYAAEAARWDVRHLAEALCEVEEALREQCEPDDYGVTDEMFVTRGRG